MWQSVKLSHTILRISLAAVFFWFGLDKFFHPEYWLNAWIPNFIINAVSWTHLSSSVVVYFFGVFELLVAISLITNMFINAFSLLAAIFLILITIINGLNEVLVRDVGLIGGLLALACWPNKQYRKY